MNDNTIFQPQAEVQQPQPGEQAQSFPTQQSTPNASPPQGGLPMGGIIKGVIGFLALIIIGILIFTVVLPVLFKPKNEKVTLTYWGLWEDKATTDGILAEFHQKNPNITIEYKKESIMGYKDRLTTRINNGSGPDVFRFHNSWTGQLRSYLLPLPKEVIEKHDLETNFFKAVQNDMTRDGVIYGIPRNYDVLSLYVNTEILQAGGYEAPKTWFDFLRNARGMTSSVDGKVQIAGTALGTFKNITHASDVVSLLMLQQGVNFKNTGNTAQNATRALDFYASFAKPQEGTNVIIWDSTREPSNIAFAKGNVAMYFGYSWDIFTIKAINPQLEFAIHPVPQLREDQKITVASYWAEGVSLKSKHKKEAQLFLKFLTEKETMQKLYTEQSKTRLFGEPYPRGDLAESIKDNQLLAPFVNQFPIGISTPFSSDTYDKGLNGEANQYLENAVNSIVNGNTSAESAANTLSSGLVQVVGKYGL